MARKIPDVISPIHNSTYIHFNFANMVGSFILLLPKPKPFLTVPVESTTILVSKYPSIQKIFYVILCKVICSGALRPGNEQGIKNLSQKPYLSLKYGFWERQKYKNLHKTYWTLPGTRPSCPLMSKCKNSVWSLKGLVLFGFYLTNRFISKYRINFCCK